MSNFTVDLSRFVKRAKAAPGVVVRRASLELLTSIVMKTPVDTGRARASWVVGIGAPSADETFTSTDKDGTHTIVRGLSVINTWQPESSVVISSNLPYMIPLEYGHSKQAPGGMVRLSIAEFDRFVDRAVRSLPKN